MNEPRTFNDLKFMVDTSNKGWFNGAFRREPVDKKGKYDVGDVVDVEYCVIFVAGTVKIVKRIHSVAQYTGCSSFTCNVKDETLGVYLSFDEFKDSEWYQEVVTAFADGDADVSWLYTVNVDESVVRTCTSESWNSYDETTYVSMGVGKTYKDFLNNNRIGKGHRQLSFNVHRMSGSFTVSDGYNTLYDVTVEDLKKAMNLYENLKNIEAEVTDSYVKFSLNPKEG